MLSEPLSVTYNGAAKSLIRLSIGQSSDNVATSRFRSSDGEFSVIITEARVKDMIRIEIRLERVEVDTDSLNGYQYIPNRFGFVYEVNPSLYNTSSDIPLLRSALNAFVDSTLQGRLIGGEK